VSSHKAVLLVVHDQTRRLRLGTAIVRRRWRLRTARSRDEAMAMLHWFSPSVIVVDLGVDRTSTPEDMVGALRERVSAERAGIVGLTDRDHDDAARVGVDALLTQPVSLPALIEAIELATPTSPAAHDEGGD
jgi:ActR/RegA family two-component response regulator